RRARRGRGGRGGMPPAASLAERLSAAPDVPGVRGLVYADLVARAVAWLLDLVVLALLGALVAGLAGLVTGGVVRDTLTEADAVDIVVLVPVLVLQLLLSALYLIVAWGRFERSIGMALVGLRVLDERDALRLPTGGAVRRWILLGIPSTLCIVWTWVPALIGWILLAGGGILVLLLLVSAIGDPIGQGYHDRIAGSIVVKPARRAR
ncbi:MAG: RDD family protein, partial [Chloroflexota bacterium]